MYEVIFLFALALIWIIFATIQDLRKREIANWVSFSLIIFALGFRFFYSLFLETGFNFFYQGLLGLGVFFLIGNFFYYGRLFAGGDAKLMIALGVILPFSQNFSVNLNIFLLFLFVFLIIGAVYSLIISLIISFRNFKKFRKEFGKIFNKNKKLLYPVMFLGLVLMISGFNTLIFYLGIIVFILPYFYIYAKAVDEACMIKKIKTSLLSEGDWLYKDVKIGKKTIKATWAGLNKKEIKMIQKSRRFVLIRHGIPFTPVFLISFLIFFYLWKTGLWQSFGFV